MFNKNRRKQTKEKHSLFIANTVYQLFNAINMRINNIPSGMADIVISDHTPILLDCINNLKESGLFDNVFYCETLAVCRGFFGKSSNDQNLLLNNPSQVLNNYKDVDFYQYSTLYAANTDIFCKLVSSLLDQIDIFLFEDGMSSYIINWYKIDIKRDASIPNYSKIYCKIKGLYVYKPELVCAILDFPSFPLPIIDRNNKNVLDTYNKIFGYKNNFELPKYVFIEQSYIVDNVKNNDFDFMQIASDVLGYDDLYIKPHPRNKTNRAYDYGLSRELDCLYPFELILMNSCLDDTVLITVNSTASMSPQILFNQDVKIVYLYKALTGNAFYGYALEEANDYMDRFTDKYNNGNIYVPKTIFQYEQTLNYLKMEANSNG